MKSFFPVAVPVLALLVAAQAFSTGGSWLVCRYTGAVMEACECVHRTAAANGASAIEDQGCCVLVRSGPAAIAAIFKLSATTAPTIAPVSLPPAATPELRAASAERHLASDPRRRRSTPLYVQVRSLLI